MKNIFIHSILLSMIFSYNTGYSGMYFYDGFTLSGSYSNQEENGEKSDALGLGFSYLADYQNASIGQPSLTGTYEISGFYNSIDTDGLNMRILNMGLGYYIGNNIKIGFHYETLLDYSGDQLDDYNSAGYNLEMTASSQIFSIGFYGANIKDKNIKNKFVFVPFLDLMILDNEVATSLTFNGNEILNEGESTITNLLRFGSGFKMNDFVIQPMVTMNEDKDKRYSISAIFKL